MAQPCDGTRHRAMCDGTAHHHQDLGDNRTPQKRSCCFQNEEGLGTHNVILDNLPAGRGLGGLPLLRGRAHPPEHRPRPHARHDPAFHGPLFRHCRSLCKTGNQRFLFTEALFFPRAKFSLFSRNFHAKLEMSSALSQVTIIISGRWMGLIVFDGTVLHVCIDGSF